MIAVWTHAVVSCHEENSLFVCFLEDFIDKSWDLVDLYLQQRVVNGASRVSHVIYA